jgi:phosphoribosylamine--glycine ligase
MNILIVGSGAREHIIAKTLKRSSTPCQLFCCGTSLNPGLKQITTQYASADITDVPAVLKLALQWQINLAIIGPEAPLEQGLADALTQHHILTVGPKKQLAQLESSKGFTRDLLAKHRIPGSPKYRYFENVTGVNDFLHELGEGNYVVKADGLMSGKGVKVAGDHLHSIQEALQFCEQLQARGLTFVIEEKLIGQEFSLHSFCDGKQIIPMPLVQDHKRAFVGDKGPNTGGMGSYSDTNHRLPFLSTQDYDQALRINEAVMMALQKDCGESYRGILYGSFMATRDGVYLIEYNTRFGDPEALNLLSLLDSDFVALCYSLANGSLDAKQVRFKPLATVCKYAVPLGYPDSPISNTPFHIDKVINKEQLYYAGVNEENGVLTATGSRTVAVVGIAPSIAEAESLAEAEINRIEGALFHREDIGKAALIHQRITQMDTLRPKELAC